MVIIQLDRVAANNGGRVIFQNLSWSIGASERIGLVGPNGAGKSTLLRMMAEQTAPSAGTITRMRAIRVGYLPQEVLLPEDQTVLAIASELPPELARIERELQHLEGQFANPQIYNDASALERVLTRQETILAAYDQLGGPHHANRVKATLIALGFKAADFDLPAAALSGGQKKLVALCKLVIDQPQVLLLDEPDNHLDLEAKQALEKFIISYNGTVITVSHDRYLLDGIATTIVELSGGQIATYPGNYTAFVAAKEINALRQQQLYLAQQKEIARIEAAIARFEYWAHMTEDERHIKQARSRRKMLDRMAENGEIIEKVGENRQIDLQFSGGRGSTKVIEAKGLSMAFDDRFIFDNVNILIQHGERVGLCGANGAGKSVLFKLILGELEPFDGVIRIGPSIRVGYYSQEHQTLQEWLHRTPIDRIRATGPISEGEAVAFLGSFLFSYQETRQPIGTLSGGERSRLQLACLVLQKPNLLLLDEPTNNLDIPSCEALEQALEQFDGTVFTISHDRYYLDKVVDRIIELDGESVNYEGGYTDYIAKRRR